ncbi:MAG: endonuclease/exonuclease/phosphatase family protein [Dysgonamonadaceae bacterium]|nr:endonuclease/exonuclease/phosphatase family protein [Dysgonamonadaceae bacterium]MDD3356080.1 endonuclease/exonuclease/phosphatase family protein [Dysgonamonadaceae bacterium]MDD4246026.1 endonuclease/exonuclease/phosphatase family protein [Dysgonamonadaceae bacterium]HUI33061.1 endonuclease/exonuclease/phosphatase family protein [Dysgonamonadaceae bacterium]
MRTIYYLLFFLLLTFSTACRNKSSSQDTKTFKIASYNVRNAKGMDDVTDFDRISKVINEMDAHAVAIQELDSATERSKGIVVLDELAKRTKMHASFNGSIEYQGGKYGIGILSKEKPLRTEAVVLPGREEKRSLLIVELDDYVLCCTHLSLNEEDRQASMKIIQNHTKKYDSKPLFLVGDLNASPDSEEISNLSENWIILNDPNQPTFPSDTPNVTIDYLFLKQNDKFMHSVIAAEVVNEPMASDHRPVVVEVEIARKS